MKQDDHDYPPVLLGQGDYQQSYPRAHDEPESGGGNPGGYFLIGVVLVGTWALILSLFL